MTKQDKLTAAEMNLEKARIEYEMALERSKLEQSHVQQSQPINQAVASNHASGSGLTPGSANDLMTFDGEDVKGKGKA